MTDRPSDEESKAIAQREAEQLRQQRRQRQLEALRREERDGIATSLGTSEEVAQEALDLGFDRETARVLPLIPLIQVAWADGKVSEAEAKEVLSTAASQGVEPGSEAYHYLEQLVTEEPSPLFFERINRVIAHIIQADPATWVKRDLYGLCEKVASASGGMFGLTSPISAEEQKLLNGLCQTFGIQRGED